MKRSVIFTVVICSLLVLSSFNASLNSSLLKWEPVTKAEAACAIDGRHGSEYYATVTAPAAETLDNWRTVALYTPTIDYGKQVVEFFLGANKIELSEVSGVNINGEVVEDAEVSIAGNPEGENFELTHIRYRLQAGSDIYIAPGTGLREQLDEPEGMLTPFWDIRYEDLAAQAIPPTAVKRASEIPDIKQFNAIVIGSPCVNPIAAYLLGNPDPCWESIPENKAIVKLYQHTNGNVALLISGRTALNTRQGCRAVATGEITLAHWPAPFVKNGMPAANLAIIVGDNAAGSDVVGAIDISEALQKAAVVTTTTGPAVSVTTMTGDAVEIGSPLDLLELGETLGEVREKLTEIDLDMLKGGQIATDDGSTEYNQYLKLGSGRIIFAEDERDEVGHYLYFEAGSVVFEWELEFEEGLESEISGSGNTRDLEDLEDEDVFILGQPFVIVDTDLSTDNKLTIELMSGATGGILGENDKEIYVINGKEYEVEVIAISETAADGEGSVKFRINGEITDELVDGETDVLADGTQIGIRDILATGKDIQKSIVDLEAIKDLYNANLQKVPIISGLFRNERINLYIEGDRNISVITKDGKIETITEDLMEDPTVNIYTDIETIEKIIGEEITFLEAVEEGAIRLEGVGFLNSLKFGVSGLLFNIYSFFSGLFQ